MVSLSPISRYSNTDFFTLSNFGFYAYSTNARHDGYTYPGPADYNPPGLFYVGISGSASGDFNGDGKQDLLVAWYASPHNVPNNLNLAPTIFLNDGQGGLKAAPNVFTGQLPLVPYRPSVADFNGDGVDDFVIAGSAAFQTPNPNGVFTNHRDPIKLVLSQPGGQMVDASSWIEGQENGGRPKGYDFGHDMSVGDVDGDGDRDFYSGKVLFLNDGKGRFTSRSDLLPPEGRLATANVMSSSIADLDGDGRDDIVVNYFEGNASYVLYSRLANGTAGWRVETLPTGLYGLQNTKFNAAATADINHDGWNDIILAETRSSPYYIGRSIQILINKQGQGFVDETTSRISNAHRDRNSGEGDLIILDVDRDGDLDIWDSTNTNEGPSDAGASIALNNGSGQFTWLDRSAFSFVKPNQLAGYEHNWEYPVPRLFPVDIDDKGGVDYYGIVYTPTPREKTEFTLYTGISSNLYGRGLDEVFPGLASSDVIEGLDGNDTFNGSRGNDRLDGGTGIDVVRYGLASSNYKTARQADGSISVQKPGAEIDVLVGVERAQFADRAVAFDVDGNAGRAYRIYQAAFDRTPDTEGLSFWIKAIDGGWSLLDVANGFVGSREFLALYGSNPDNAGYISKLYQNVLGRDGEPGGLAFWQGQMNNGMSKAVVLANFSESQENIAGVAPVIMDGIWYI